MAVKDSWRIEVTPEGVERFLATHGTRGAKTLSLLGRGEKFYNTITSEIGQVLLNDLMVKMEMLLIKIVGLSATDEEKIEYKLAKELFDKWVAKIYQHRRAAEKLMGKS